MSSQDRLTQLFEKVITCFDESAEKNNTRIKIRQRDDYLFKSAEYEANQTAATFVAAPGANHRLVVKTLAMTGNGTTGEAYLNGTVDGSTIIIGKIYMTKYNTIVEGNISIPLDENTPITVTSTTGTDKLFIQLNYVTDEINKCS